MIKTPDHQWVPWNMVLKFLVLEENSIPENMTKEKTTMTQKDPLKRKHYQKLLIDNVSTYDVENSKHIKKRRIILLISLH